SCPVLVAGLLLWTSCPVTFSQSVQVPDPNLLAPIRQALNKPSGDITVADMLNLTNLSAAGISITNLEGLETATNLKTLDLSYNWLSSFSFPLGLTNLNTPDLSGNFITNFSAPAGLANLLTLSLYGNRLNSLELPAGLTNLTTLT